VDEAVQASSRDQKVAIQEEIDAKADYVNNLKQIWAQLDPWNTGIITLEEFEEKVQEDTMRAYFSRLKLDVSDASVLFGMLDADDSGSIEIDEFLQGCLGLHGTARSLDVKIMHHQIRHMCTMLNDIYGEKLRH